MRVAEALRKEPEICVQSILAIDYVIFVSGIVVYFYARVLWLCTHILYEYVWYVLSISTISNIDMQISLVSLQWTQNLLCTCVETFVAERHSISGQNYNNYRWTLYSILYSVAHWQSVYLGSWYFILSVKCLKFDGRWPNADIIFRNMCDFHNIVCGTRSHYLMFIIVTQSLFFSPPFFWFVYTPKLKLTSNVS